MDEEIKVIICAILARNLSGNKLREKFENPVIARAVAMDFDNKNQILETLARPKIGKDGKKFLRKCLKGYADV